LVDSSVFKGIFRRKKDSRDYISSPCQTQNFSSKESLTKKGLEIVVGG